jgi:hypothetical protein
MVPMWVRFTTLHGPTSFNENGHWLGGSSIFWGGMMGFAGLLIVLGLHGHRILLVEGRGRSARIGYWLTMIGLGVPAVVDLAIRAAVPPLLMPLAAIGLTCLAVAHRHNASLPTTGRVTLVVLATVLSVAFLTVAIPLETSDSIQGYRLYGILANVLFGLGWAVFGASLARNSTRSRVVQPAEQHAEEPAV